jgi:hypothetical protein
MDTIKSGSPLSRYNLVLILDIIGSTPDIAMMSRKGDRKVNLGKNCAILIHILIVWSGNSPPSTCGHPSPLVSLEQRFLVVFF